MRKQKEAKEFRVPLTELLGDLGVFAALPPLVTQTMLLIERHIWRDPSDPITAAQRDKGVVVAKTSVPFLATKFGVSHATMKRVFAKLKAMEFVKPVSDWTACSAGGFYYAVGTCPPSNYRRRDEVLAVETWAKRLAAEQDHFANTKLNVKKLAPEKRCEFAKNVVKATLVKAAAKRAKVLSLSVVASPEASTSSEQYPIGYRVTGEPRSRVTGEPRSRVIRDLAPSVREGTENSVPSHTSVVCDNGAFSVNRKENLQVEGSTNVDPSTFGSPTSQEETREESDDTPGASRRASPSMKNPRFHSETQWEDKTRANPLSGEGELSSAEGPEAMATDDKSAAERLASLRADAAKAQERAATQAMQNFVKKERKQEQRHKDEIPDWAKPVGYKLIEIFDAEWVKRWPGVDTLSFEKKHWGQLKHALGKYLDGKKLIAAMHYMIENWDKVKWKSDLDWPSYDRYFARLPDLITGSQTARAATAKTNDDKGWWLELGQPKK